MQLKQKIVISLIVGLIYSSAALANYASKAYVDNAVNNLSKQIDEVRIKPHFIGETYQGGIIFWLDDSQQHGLIAAKIDANASQSIQWQNGESGDRVTNARANALFAGLLNTQLIISEQTLDDQEGEFAALCASQFAVQANGEDLCIEETPCYGNWYLPSLYELSLLKTNLVGLGEFSSGLYWSSTENGVNEAWCMDLQAGTKSLCDKSNQALVRAIRAF